MDRRELVNPERVLAFRLLVVFKAHVELCPDTSHQQALALEVYTREAFPEKWARTQNNLGLAYSARIRGERAENLEQAIVHYEQALAVYTRAAFPEQWAMTQNNLANVYLTRIRGERAENLEQAIVHYERALAVYTRAAFPEQWAMAQNNLANVYLTRTRGERAENLEQAIAHYERAFEVRTREAFPGDWAMTHDNLGLAYSARILGERAENLEQAIVHYEQALDVRTREAFPGDWAMTQNNLANAYRDRVRGDRAENLEQAIAHCEQALEALHAREGFGEQWAMTQNSLANAYAARIRGERAENVEQAIEHYHHALEVRTREAYPAPFQQTRRNLGNLYFAERDWARAQAAYQEAIRAEKLLLASAYTETGRRAEAAETSGLYARAAYALLKRGKAGEALEQLEQGKTRLLSQALALNEVDVSSLSPEQRESIHSLRETIRNLEAEMCQPPNTASRRDDRRLAGELQKARTRLNQEIETIRAAHPNFIPEGLNLSQILSLIPKDSVLVAPVVTSHGSAVLAVAAGMQSISMDQLLWLDDFKERDLQTVLKGPPEEPGWGGWLGAYFNSRTDAKSWFNVIETTGQVLWDRLMEPIHRRLADLKASHVLLMPQGGLGLLPLHAAWREVDGQKRYFLDDYTVSYVPSAYALSVSHDRLRDEQRHHQTLFAVINPTKNLPFTPLEGEQLIKLFGKENSVCLQEDKATPEAVKQASSSYLHFCCHGFYNWRNAMQSGLLLANGEPFTLGEIIGSLNLDATRLVTLSACETGITEFQQSPDEYLGLPAGFLQAGAPAVVSTLWAVNDLSTMLLMERFYRLHVKEGRDIPASLREAQRWLRRVSTGELAKRFAEEEELALSQTRMPIETASEYFSRFAPQNPSDRPFDHPYYWAAFTFSGA